MTNLIHLRFRMIRCNNLGLTPRMLRQFLGIFVVEGFKNILSCSAFPTQGSIQQKAWLGKLPLRHSALFELSTSGSLLHHKRTVEVAFKFRIEPRNTKSHQKPTSHLTSNYSFLHPSSLQLANESIPGR